MRVRSPLLAQSLLISSPRGTEMFHFPRCRLAGLCIQPEIAPHDGRGVAPFGNLRIKVCLPLPAAYRSLPRPSSPRDAKASIVCPYTLGRRSKPSPSRYVAILLPRLCSCQRATPPESGEIRLCAETLRDWWACLESNQGPRPYQGRALTN